jgi:predicted DNA-binding antitoxin AbrB/MazE fold protein
MAKTIRAVFDGEVLRPEQPTDLKPQQTYEITIEREVSSREGSATEEYPLTQIAKLARDVGVEDLSTGHDRYAHRRVRSDGENS